MQSVGGCHMIHLGSLQEVQGRYKPEELPDLMMSGQRHILAYNSSLPAGTDMPGTDTREAFPAHSRILPGAYSARLRELSLSL